MNMGRLMVGLLLVVVGAGCNRGEKAQDIQLAAECPVTKAYEWPSGAKQNPSVVISSGATAFVFDKDKKMRARFHSAKTRSYVLPLKELRNDDEPLIYGVAPQSCWQADPDPVRVMCVRCSPNINLSEPCCF